MKIEEMQSGLPIDRNQKNRLKQKAAENAEKSPYDKMGKGEKLSISQEARRAFEEEMRIRALKGEVDKIPEVRQDKIDAATEKIESGFFDTEEGIEAVADAILNSPDAMALINPNRNLEEALEELSGELVGGLSPERTNEILDRIRDGFYDKPEVIQQTVEKLLKDLNLEE